MDLYPRFETCDGKKVFVKKKVCVLSPVLLASSFFAVTLKKRCRDGAGERAILKKKVCDK